MRILLAILRKQEDKFAEMDVWVSKKRNFEEKNQ